LSNDKRLQDARQYWDDIAPSFDDEPDHGLRDPVILASWTQLFKAWLPVTPVNVLDIGCGTGSLSVVLAGLGHKVTGIDLSPKMISLAREKAARQGYPIEFRVMDAAFPHLPHKQFDVIVCRHLLWALPEPAQVLQRWAELLKSKGRLLLVEGHWETGGGLHAKQITEILPPLFTSVLIQDLSDNSKLWGKEVIDERYAVIADFNH
jgi:2-polyprenyl-3-methyl-5-hydroxy-6-metoxy-1,4-benzoquinol methylase